MLETNPKLASGNNDCDGDDDGELPRKIFFPGAKILSTGKTMPRTCFYAQPSIKIFRVVS